MSKAKTGDVLGCEVCGITVIVDEECGCAGVGLSCCEELMINKGPAAPKKKPALKIAKPAKKKPAKKPLAKKKPAKKKK
jgi:hypothetical protein